MGSSVGTRPGTEPEDEARRIVMCASDDLCGGSGSGSGSDSGSVGSSGLASPTGAQLELTPKQLEEAFGSLSAANDLAAAIVNVQSAIRQASTAERAPAVAK